MTSDLSKFYRTPKINIKLPSNLKFYPEGFIETGIDGRIAINQMTAKDELMLKTPDSLMNGGSILHIIQSCVPSIKNPKELLAPDVEAILLGIFFASYGPTLDFKHTCPKCSHENEFEVPIRNVLDNQTEIEYPAFVEKDLGIIDNSDTKIKIYVKPYTFECNTKQQLALFEQTKIIQLASKENTASEEETMKIASDCIQKMINIKFENISNSIMCIDIKKKINNEWQIESIDNKEEIIQFIENTDKDIIDPVIEKIDLINKQGIDNSFGASCIKCKHEWKTTIEFNPATFFVKSSKH